MSRPPFRAAGATGPDWESTARTCAARLGLCPPAPGSQPFGLVYLTEAMAPHLPAVVEILRTATGIEPWAGCVGAGVCAIAEPPAGGPPQGWEAHTGFACSALVGSVRRGELALQTGLRQPEEAPAAIPTGWDAPRPWLGLMHGDGRNGAVLRLIGLLPEVCDAYLVGGLGADAGHATQVIGRGVTGGGLSGLWFSGAVPVAVGLTQGCRPLGPARVITAMEGDWIAELDGRPALLALAADLGSGQDPDSLHVAVPVDAADTGDYLVRNLLAVDTAGGRLAVAADLAEGDRLLFVRRDPEAAADDLRRMLRRTLARAGGRAPRGAVYVSCLARGPHMFAPPGELALIGQELGPVPLTGFFAGGEINRDRLYAYTGVLLLFLDQDDRGDPAP